MRAKGYSNEESIRRQTKFKEGIPLPLLSRTCHGSFDPSRIEEVQSKEEQCKISEEGGMKEAEEEAAKSIEHVSHATNLVLCMEDIQCGLRLRCRCPLERNN